MKLWFWTIFIKFATKNAVFCRSAQQELNVSYEISIFRSMFMWHNYWWKNYTEETELDTNPSLTLARTLTLSTGERISGHFTFSRCYDTTIFNLAYMNSPKNLGRDPESRSEIDSKWKITIAWNWCLKNNYAGNRSSRKKVSDHVDWKEIQCL